MTEPNRPADWKSLYTAVLSDALDAVGMTAQAMTPRIRPLDDALLMVGRARTGLYMESVHVEPGNNPYALEITLIDDLRPGEVAI